MCPDISFPQLTEVTILTPSQAKFLSVFFLYKYNNNNNLLRYSHLHTWHYLFS